MCTYQFSKYLPLEYDYNVPCMSTYVLFHFCHLGPKVCNPVFHSGAKGVSE